MKAPSVQPTGTVPADRAAPASARRRRARAATHTAGGTKAPACGERHEVAAPGLVEAPAGNARHKEAAIHSNPRE